MSDNPYGLTTSSINPSTLKKSASFSGINLPNMPKDFGTVDPNTITMDTKMDPSTNYSLGGESNLPSFEASAGSPIGAKSSLGGLFDSLGGLEGISKFGSMIGGIMTAMNGQDYMRLMKDQYNTQKAATNIGLENQGRIADTTNGIQGYLRGGAQGLTGDALNAFNDKYVQQHALSNARV
jgi:hypothetical protein